MCYGPRVCRSYVQTRRSREQAHRITKREEAGVAALETWNLCSATSSMVIKNTSDGLLLGWLSWGIHPYAPPSGDRATHARVERASIHPLFKGAWRSRRCVIPAEGWFEWRNEREVRQPYYFYQKSGHPLFFAALWTEGAFAILTTAADGHLAEIHNRRPICLDLARSCEWIENEPRAGEPLRDKMIPGEEIRFHPVSRKASNSRSEGPDLIKPITLTDDSLDSQQGQLL
jgi:putative SOS response-associated peptidase YedK